MANRWLILFLLRTKTYPKVGSTMLNATVSASRVGLQVSHISEIEDDSLSDRITASLNETFMIRLGRKTQKNDYKSPGGA